MNNKILIIMLEIINKTTLKCKVNLMDKCLIKNKIKIKIKRENLCQEMNKWDKSKMKSVNNK
jgi:hypothetical protein